MTNDEIEAVKARGMRLYNRLTEDDSTAFDVQDMLAAITALQARVADLEAERDSARRTAAAQMDATNEASRVAYMAAESDFRDRVAAAEGRSYMLDDCNARQFDIITTLRADLAAYKAAVAEVVGRADYYNKPEWIDDTEGIAADISEPLRALAEPAKQGGKPRP